MVLKTNFCAHNECKLVFADVRSLEVLLLRDDLLALFHCQGCRGLVCQEFRE
jgi:hypothetical protein